MGGRGQKSAKDGPQWFVFVYDLLFILEFEVNSLVPLYMSIKFLYLSSVFGLTSAFDDLKKHFFIFNTMHLPGNVTKVAWIQLMQFQVKWAIRIKLQSWSFVYVFS